MESGFDLIFGGSNVGLMDILARQVRKKGGKIISVILDKFHNKGISFTDCDELIITKTMGERKDIMAKRGKGFIALPGGFGTLEELSEIITQKYIKNHNYAIILLNINGFYDSLINFFDKIIEEKFATDKVKQMYYIASSVDECMEYLLSYTPFEFIGDWLSTNDYQWNDNKL